MIFLLRDHTGTISFSFSLDIPPGGEISTGRITSLAVTKVSELIALAVLYVFLRQWRAVAVVAVAVPVSLLAAAAMLYLLGLSLNLVTLFGLAVGLSVAAAVYMKDRRPEPAPRRRIDFEGKVCSITGSIGFGYGCTCWSAWPRCRGTVSGIFGPSAAMPRGPATFSRPCRAGLNWR